MLDCVCVRACVRACECACVRVRICVCVKLHKIMFWIFFFNILLLFYTIIIIDFTKKFSTYLRKWNLFSVKQKLSEIQIKKRIWYFCHTYILLIHSAFLYPECLTMKSEHLALTRTVSQKIRILNAAHIASRLISKSKFLGKTWFRCAKRSPHISLGITYKLTASRLTQGVSTAFYRWTRKFLHVVATGTGSIAASSPPLPSPLPKPLHKSITM